MGKTMKQLLLAGVALLMGTTVMAARKRAARKAAKPAVVQTVDGTGNLSKSHREELIGKITAIRDFLQKSPDTNAVRLLEFVGQLEKEVRTKKYGLVFEEHKERVDVELENNLPVLTEDRKRFIDNGGELNFLIEGDNLAALKLLEKTHKGKIDLIYIDPPYNTGNKDFMYNDCYVEKDDSFKHSKWLSFMEKRLRIAQTLLSSKGVIFISINDFELATLRLLCDDIFRDENFVGQLTWESTTQPTNAGKARFELQKKVESILCFARDKGKKPPFILQQVDIEKKYPHKGMLGRCRFAIIEKSDKGASNRETMKFKILGKYPRAGKRWQIGEDVARDLERSSRVEIVDGIVKRVIYPEDELVAQKFIPFWSHFQADKVGTAESGKDQLNEILGQNIGFDTVKPVALMLSLIDHFPNDVTVVDFFAGSGTTGHAVMKLNAEDGGKRKFILVTNNENGICEKVTYERLKRVIKKEDYQARVKYLKVDYVPITQKVYEEYADELLKHIRELVELENGLDFDHDKSVAIAVTKDEFDGLVDDEKRLKGCKVIYVGHDVLVGTKAKRTLLQHEVDLRVIPEYYYGED